MEVFGGDGKYIRVAIPKESGEFTQKTPLVGDFRDSKGGLSRVGLSCNKPKWNREVFLKTRGVF